MSFIKKIMFNSCKKYAMDLFKSQIISALNSSSTKSELGSIVNKAIDPTGNNIINTTVIDRAVADIINSVSCKVESL